MRLRAASLAALVAAGCTAAPPDPSDGLLRVVATTTQVGEAAQAVGGHLIRLTVLLPPGAEAHEFEITPPAAAAIEDADLILKSGAGLESWLDPALATIGGADRVRDMSAGIALRRAAGDSAETEIDPHWWLSGPNAIRLIENVSDALAAASPRDTDAFAAAAAAYVARLRDADVEIRRLIAEVPLERRGIVTNHDALGYFLAEYGLRFVGSIFPSLDVSADPNPGQLADLADTIRREGVTAIFSESAVNPRLARAIAAETGARVVDAPLYTDSLGSSGSGAETLDGMLLHDAQVIHDALIGFQAAARSGWAASGSRLAKTRPDLERAIAHVNEDDTAIGSNSQLIAMADTGLKCPENATVALSEEAHSLWSRSLQGGHSAPSTRAHLPGAVPNLKG